MKCNAAFKWRILLTLKIKLVCRNNLLKFKFPLITELWQSVNKQMEKQNDVEVARERESGAAEAIAEPQSLSFPEVFRMIQAGEEVPGLQKLEIKPCHEQPTVSQMPRKSKPWEK